MTEAELRSNIDEMVRRIVEQFHPERVVLFGSCAHGTMGPDSDVDLLVVMDPLGTRRQAAVAIGLALADRTVPLDVFVVTPRDVEQYRDMIGSVIRPALREGKVLFERAA